jgi:hypothetical protein
LRFENNIVNNEDYNLVRMFDNNLIYIKDNVIKFIDTKIKSKLIKQKKRAMQQDTKYITFDIECYLEKITNNYNNNNNDDIDEEYKFIPYCCA